MTTADEDETLREAASIVAVSMAAQEELLIHEESSGQKIANREAWLRPKLAELRADPKRVARALRIREARILRESEGSS